MLKSSFDTYFVCTFCTKIWYHFSYKIVAPLKICSILLLLSEKEKRGRKSATLNVAVGVSPIAALLLLHKVVDGYDGGVGGGIHPSAAAPTDFGIHKCFHRASSS